MHTLPGRHFLDVAPHRADCAPDRAIRWPAAEDVELLYDVASQVRGKCLCALGEFSIEAVVSGIERFHSDFEVADVEPQEPPLATSGLRTTMAKMVTLTIDGIQVEVPEGTVVVDAAKKAGVDIPVFCYHPKMEPVGCAACAWWRLAAR